MVALKHARQALYGLDRVICMQHPMRQTDDLVFRGRAVVVRSLLVGVGASCRGFPWCRPKYAANWLLVTSLAAKDGSMLLCAVVFLYKCEMLHNWPMRRLPCSFGRSRLADDKVVSWRRRFLTCMGQPADAHVASLPTNVLLINRPTSVGRAFLNIDDVLEGLKVVL